MQTPNWLLKLLGGAGKAKVWVSAQPTQADVMAAIPEATVGKMAESRRPRQKTSSPTLIHNSRGSIIRDAFSRPEYDLAEIAKARDTEAYVRLSFDQLKTRILREPWSLRSRNDETVAYVLSRIREAELASNTSFNQLLRQVVVNLVQYSNAFIIKVRDAEFSSGEVVRRYGRDLAPVIAFFSADPTTMEPKRDSLGNILQWRQYIPGVGEKFFRKENVIHIAYDRQDGFVFGTPWIIPALDDIRALRRLEELIELLVGKQIFPLFHYKVGTEELPAEEYDDGTSEVDVVRNAVEAMPTEGCIVTSERHTIQAISADAIDAKPYLEYFESRVLSGLRISNVDSGRGDTSNRATAGFLSAAKDDLAKDMQDVLTDFFMLYLFDELLEEGGYPLTEDNRVSIVWPPIDPEEQRKREAHVNLLYQSNLISEPEARMAINKQPITEEQRKEMFFELITKPQIELQGDIKLQQLAASASLKAKNQPSNQHGTKSTASRPKNDEEETMVNNTNKTTTYSFAIGHIIDSIFQEEGEKALDMDAGEDGLDKQTIEEYHASYLEVDKTLSAEERNRLKSSTFCGPGRSFPVPDCKHYSAALRLLGRYKGGGSKDKIRSCINAKGKKLGCTSDESK